MTTETVQIVVRQTGATGRPIGTGTTVFRTDGHAHPHDALLPGLTVVATRPTPRRVDTVLTRRNGVVDRVSYVVSPDGLELTTHTEGPFGRQTIIFTKN